MGRMQYPASLLRSPYFLCCHLRWRHHAKSGRFLLQTFYSFRHVTQNTITQLGQVLWGLHWRMASRTSGGWKKAAILGHKAVPIVSKVSAAIATHGRRYNGLRFRTARTSSTEGLSAGWGARQGRIASFHIRGRCLTSLQGATATGTLPLPLLFLKRLLPRHHLIKNYAQRINVRRRGSLTVLLHFRRHVAGSATKQIGVSGLVSSQSKISNDHPELFIFFERGLRLRA